MTPVQQVQAACNTVIAKARELYGLDLSNVAISFNLKGRVAGWACWKRKLGIATYKVKFNYDMIARGDVEALRDMVEDTVPHEFAHIVCYMNPALGKNHDAGWQRVCLALGGTAKRTHDVDVVFGRGTTYEYTTDRGHKVRLNERRHQYVQAGMPLTYRKGLGTVTRGCAYSIVGAHGRTLTAPIVKQATPVQVNTPSLLETALEVVRSVPPKPPVVATVAPTVQAFAQGGDSKAAVSRRIMLSGYQGGKSYETIIAEMIAANGYNRQLARGTFKANAPKVGIPQSFYS